MLISQEVEVKWNHSNKKYYISKGYLYTNYGDVFMCKVEDLSEGSHAIVEVLCDYCNETIIKKEYRIYLKAGGKIKKDSCIKCHSAKLLDTFTYKYTFDEINKKFQERDYTLTSTTVGKTSEYLTYICNKHKEIGEQNILLAGFLQGHGCKYCGWETTVSYTKLDFDYVKSVFTNRGYVLLEEKYINSRKPMRFLCPFHPDKKTFITFTALSNGCGCKYCGFESIKNSKIHPIDYVIEQFEKRGYTINLNKYKGNLKQIYYTCEKHRDKGELRIGYASFRQGHGCKYCAWDSISGENSVHYKFDMPLEERIVQRQYQEYNSWVTKVYKKDHYTCQICGKYGGKLNAHHLFNYKDYPDLRIEITNGTTMCYEHHILFHKIFGKHHNTPEQFEQFKELIQNNLNFDNINIISKGGDGVA
jgi:5-methylcytosine-specific restriction endonuclease McrA